MVSILGASGLTHGVSNNALRLANVCNKWRLGVTHDVINEPPSLNHCVIK